MKLVRLTTTDSNVFSNNIQGDLVLEPDSQIALLNVGFEKQAVQYKTQDDIFRYNIGLTTDVQIEKLENETYNKNNFKDLLNDIEEKLNQSMDVMQPTLAGSGWLVNLKSNKVKITTDYGPFAQVIDPFNKFDNTGVSTTGPNVYQKTDGSSETTANASLASSDLVAFDGRNGCGYFRFTLNELGDNAGEGVYIGLSTIEPKDMGGSFTFDTSKLTYGIWAEQSSTGYKIIENNSITTSPVTPENFTLGEANNDVLCIQASLGKIDLIIYNDSNPDGRVLGTTTYTGNLELFPIIGFYSKNNTSIRRVRYTPYDELKSSSKNSSIISSIKNPPNFDDQEGTPSPPTQDVSDHTPMTFQFPNIQLTEFLGYENQFIDVAPDDIFSLTGNHEIQFTEKSESYIVELMNLQIESFDGFLEQRKNILQVINNSRESTLDDVLFEANNLIFLDLNNSHQQILRNIDVRVVTDTYTDVNIQNRANMTLLIKSKNEK